MKRKTEEIELSKEFVAIVQDILESEEFIGMKKCKHHIKSSQYAHSVKVAYLCFKHHRRFRLKIDIRELTRGAMLHDYYLYDPHDKSASHKFHWFKHPQTALLNAIQKYPDLSYAQRDMIKHHMFPLTPVPPMTRAGWLVCFYDKVAAISDRFEKSINPQTGCCVTN